MTRFILGVSIFISGAVVGQVATVNVNRTVGQNVAGIVSLPEQSDATVPFQTISGRIDFPIIAGATQVKYLSHKAINTTGKLTIASTATGIDFTWVASADGAHTGDLFQVVMRCEKAGTGTFAFPVTAKNAAGQTVAVGVENTCQLIVSKPNPVVRLTIGNQQ